MTDFYLKNFNKDTFLHSAKKCNFEIYFRPNQTKTNEIFIYTFFIFISCNPSEKKLTAQQIIDKTIVNSGADKVANSEITFKFRDKEYSAIRKNGNFKLSRKFKRYN